jgi:hypothetical protein
MKRLIHLISLVSLTLPVWAGEYVVLGNGFRLHADRHENAGDKVLIYSNGGITEIAAATVSGYEDDGVVPPPPAPPVPVAAPQPTPVAEAPATPAELAALAARKFALPEKFVRSVMRAESGFQPAAVSPKGAIGLMQLMPETARQLGVDPTNPQKNAEGGAQYLRELLARYEGDPNQVLLALAAYNAGPAAVERYHGVPPFRETREYILRVLKNWEREGGN